MAFASGILFSSPPQTIVFWDRPDSPVDSAYGALYQANPWDTLHLGGIQIPGLCAVKAMPTIHFDKKKPPGSDGLTITSQGYIPGPVEIDITLWTREQWETYQAVRARLWVTPQRGGKIKALDISHPATDDAKIFSIVIEGISLPEAGSIPGSKTVKIKAVQFLPASTKNAAHTIDRSNVELDARQDPNAKHIAANSSARPSPGQNQTGPTGIAG